MTYSLINAQFSNMFQSQASAVMSSMSFTSASNTPVFDFSSFFNVNFSNFNFNIPENKTYKSGNCTPSVKLDKAFLEKVKQIAAKVGCDYKDLLGVMNSESGLNSKAVNKNGGATGLIQFMPSTARSLGTSTEALKNMTPIEQLDYVEKYLLKMKSSSKLGNKKLSGGDLYSLVFLPAFAGKEVLCDSSSKYYRANKGLDTNGDKKITNSELSQRVASRHVNESIFS